MNIKPFIAEFIGTFTLIFVGVGSIAANHITNGAVGLTGIALAHGLAIAIMVAATASTSGGHLNPAVTIALLSAKKIEPLKAFGYVVSQLLGGIVAALLIKSIIPSDVTSAISMGTPSLNSSIGISPMTGIIIEAVLTFFLVFVICLTAVDSRGTIMAPLFIGLTITADILTGGPLTGSAMNPARHLGPALLGGGMANTWVYWVGPILGGIVAAQLYSIFLVEKQSEK